MKDAMMEKPIFTKKQIFALLIPLMIEQVLNSLMGTADTMMVTRAGNASVSAVSLVDSINVLIIYIFSALATGGAIVCSQYIGSRNTERANAAGKQLLLSVTVLSLAVSALCLLFCRPLLQLIFGHVEAAVMAESEIYFRITALSFPFIALYNAAAALFRVCNNARLPMVISTAANGVNILGNAVLIFGFGLGAAGAALATLISRVLCAVAVLYALRLPRQEICLRDYRIRPEFPLIGCILALGIPTGIENGMFQFGKLAIQSTVSTMTTSEIAAQAMIAALEQLTSNAAIGIGLGMVTVVGQCIGAGRMEEARQNIKRLTGYAAVAVTAFCAFVFLIVRPVVFLGDMEPVAAELTVRLTRLFCLCKPFLWPLAFIPAYGMRAAGDVRFPMITSSITMWIFRVALVIFLVRVYGFGPLAVWLGMFTDWGVRSICFSLRFHSNRWQAHTVIGK